ncbi:hypothetical protein QJS64_16035 [Paraclostridium bifermentans]|uniref:Uncharacterized protein n=1 Tax=Paraclostridium bifermentans TaxID=1490 RepID=A0ABY8R1Q9_PARBF|nr:hypothetical protein QJS64_16035 [Paraclostridium bifermentans]
MNIKRTSKNVTTIITCVIIHKDMVSLEINEHFYIYCTVYINVPDRYMYFVARVNNMTYKI